jgi:hypothetical protein
MCFQTSLAPSEGYPIPAPHLPWHLLPAAQAVSAPHVRLVLTFCCADGGRGGWTGTQLKAEVQSVILTRTKMC